MGSCFSSDEQKQHTPGKTATKANTKSPKSLTTRKSSNKHKSSNDRPVTRRTVMELRQSPGNNHLHIFTYEELREATKQFRPDRILGDGGFGMVYKGEIYVKRERSYYTMPVAIKKLNPEGYQGDTEWMTEVNLLGNVRHENVVKLIGYCCEGEQRLLVYEYMASGSLEKHLFRDGKILSWTRRMKIALDAARGLAFLHNSEGIIYRDFKTSNILLDENLNAKLSDFGLAKDAPAGDQTHVSTRVMGTYGYASPEYMLTGHLTEKADVYGFGVVLLEMMTGRSAIDRNKSPSEQKLVDFALPYLVDYKTLQPILDQRMKGQYRQKDIGPVAILALKCLNPDAKARPSMKDVVDVLEAVRR